MRRVTARRQQVFGAPGDAVQGTAIASAGDFVIGAFRLFDGEFFGVSGDAFERGIVALEPADEHLGQLERGDLATFE